MASFSERKFLPTISSSSLIGFTRLYTVLPPHPPEFLVSRTFIVLPKYGSRAKDHFQPSPNKTAENEIDSHTGMFSASTNDGYYQLGLTTAQIIRDAVMGSRGIGNAPSPSPQPKVRRSTRSPTKSPTKETIPTGNLVDL